MKRIFITRLILVAFFVIVLCTVGQSQPANPDSALQIILSQLESTRLPLRDAVQHALNNATSVRTAEAVYFAARGTERREAGSFDPELFFNLNYLDQEQPTASFF